MARKRPARDVLCLRSAAPPQGGVTTRAVVVGLLGVIVLGVITPYCDMVLRGTWIACSHLPIGVVMLFLLWLGVEALLRKLGQRGFTAPERLTIYAMMLVGAGIPSFGLTAYLFPTLAGAYYFASPENAWIERFFPLLPQWLFPYDLEAALASTPTGNGKIVGSAFYALLPKALQPGGRSLVVGFYEGLRPGQPLPWGPWLVPLAMWTLAAALLFGGMICLCVLLRRRWIEQERLVFPLVQIPVELAREPTKKAPAFFRQRWMWIGAVLPLLVHTLNGLHFYFPAIPELRLVIPLNQYFKGRLWSYMGPFVIFVHFSVIGFTYLIATELAFSFWFFFLLFILEGVFVSALGLDLKSLPGYATPPHGALQMIGAFLMITAAMMWTGRRHWQELWEQALGRGRENEAEEPLPIRVALFGGLALLALFGLWALAAGVAGQLIVPVLVLFLVFAIVLTRLVSEGGLLFVQAFRPTDVMIAAAGTRIFDPRSLTLLSFIQKIFMFDLRAFLMPSVMDAFKLAEVGGLPPRRLLPPLGLAIGAAIASSYVAFLAMAYHYGAVRFSTWFLHVSPQQTLQFVAGYLNQPYATNVANWLLMLIGAGTTAFLAAMRARYVWWPFHPLGYAMGPSWPMIQLWFSSLLGWALKALILRYGGFKRYQQAKPFFLGLVVGEFSAAGLWLLIDFICGKRDHRFFLT